MLSFFKRHQKASVIEHHHSPFTYLTLSEFVKPMTIVEFETAQQSLENASEWLYQLNKRKTGTDCDNFSRKDVENGNYQEALSRALSRRAIPIVLTNCAESVLSSMPVLFSGSEEVGLVNLSHSMGLKATLDVKLGTAFHFALTRYHNTRAFFVGVNESHTSSAVWEHAEDLGCNWLTEKEFTFRHRNDCKEHLGSFIDHCDRLVISIDLASIVAKASIEDCQALDMQMVMRTLRQCLLSGKTTFIQIVGDRDKLIYSRECKNMLEELDQLTDLLHHAA